MESQDFFLNSYIQNIACIVSVIFSFFGVLAYIKTWAIDKIIHETPRLKFDVEFDPYDFTKDLDQRFTQPVDRLILYITNESYRPLTIAAIYCEYKGITRDETSNSFSGCVFDSFIHNDVKKSIGRKLNQSDMEKIEIRDSKVLDHLVGLSIKSTYRDTYELPEEVLRSALQKRADFLAKRNQSCF